MDGAYWYFPENLDDVEVIGKITEILKDPNLESSRREVLEWVLAVLITDKDTLLYSGVLPDTGNVSSIVDLDSMRKSWNWDSQNTISSEISIFVREEDMTLEDKNEALNLLIQINENISNGHTQLHHFLPTYLQSKFNRRLRDMKPKWNWDKNNLQKYSTLLKNFICEEIRVLEQTIEAWKRETL